MTDAAIVGTSPRTLPACLRWTEAQPAETQGAITQVTVEFRALGPVEAVVAGRPVDLGAPKQRALLALLVSRVGQPVAVEVIREALWAGHPPPSAMTSLQAYVANLRRVLEPDRAPRTPATVLRTCPGGYLLDNRVVDVDVHRFGEHATAGWRAWDRGDPQQALSEFEAALALWRGEAATLAEMLAALARTGMTRIELNGLSIQETQTLAGAVLHQEVSECTAEGLWARTEGNPFFLRELINLLTSEQCLDQPHTAPVPVPVREVVLRRVARLPQTAAEMLSVAAVAGRHFDIEVVAEAASVEIEAALEVLDTAVAAGLIVEDQQRLGWFRFTHALAAEALYETTGRLRRTGLRRRIGAAAARARTGDSERAAEIARHRRPAAERDPTAAATPQPTPPPRPASRRPTRLRRRHTGGAKP